MPGWMRLSCVWILWLRRLWTDSQCSFRTRCWVSGPNLRQTTHGQHGVLLGTLPPAGRHRGRGGQVLGVFKRVSDLSTEVTLRGQTQPCSSSSEPGVSAKSEALGVWEGHQENQEQVQCWGLGNTGSTGEEEENSDGCQHSDPGGQRTRAPRRDCRGRRGRAVSPRVTTRPVQPQQVLPPGAGLGQRNQEWDPSSRSLNVGCRQDQEREMKHV